MSIEIRNISKRFGSFEALVDVSLTVPSGQLVALLGPSGSGKTTLLRIIAGLEQADPGSGPILFHDEDVAGRHVRHRQVGFVFQHYALFRHMTVFENIAFGLRVKPAAVRPSLQEIRRRVGDLLRLIQLEPLADRYPNQLSGGQRQRVALARALAVEPAVLLLDEPFGALDAKVRRELRAWLRRLHDEIHVTSVFVTHDQDEALEVADHVVVMNAGRIEQSGTPDDVFHRPASEFVMRFLGEVNGFHGRVVGGQVMVGDVGLPNLRLSGGPSGEAVILARPHELELSLAAGPGAITGAITRVHAAGPDVRVEVTTRRGENLVVSVPHDRVRELGLTAGGDVHVSLKTARVFAGSVRSCTIKGEASSRSSR